MAHLSYRVTLSEFRWTVSISRIVFVGLIFLCWYNIDELNKVVEVMWEKYLLQSDALKYHSFDPLLSSLTFSVVMSMWVSVDFYIPYFHRYRISRSDDVKTYKGRESALWKETFWYIAPWLVVDFFMQRRELPISAPTLPTIIWQILLAFIVFDLFFYIGHRSFHASKFLFKHVHSVHHTSPVIRAADGVRHTFWDGTYGVLCSVLALKLTHAHPLSSAIFNIIASILICEIHSGMNFPWGLHNLLPLHFMAGPIVHDTHHRNGKVNFQKYLTYLDYLFGTLKIEPTLQEKEALEMKKLD